MVWQVGSRRRTSRRVLGRPTSTLQDVVPPLPDMFTGRFGGDVAVEGTLPELPLCVLGMSLSRLPRLRPRMQSISCEAPFQLRRRSFGAAPRSPQGGSFGCSQSLGRLLAPAFRLAVQATLTNPRPLLVKGSLRRRIRRSAVEGLGNGGSGLRGRLAGVGTRAAG